LFGIDIVNPNRAKAARRSHQAGNVSVYPNRPAQIYGPGFGAAATADVSFSVDKLMRPDGNRQLDTMVGGAPSQTHRGNDMDYGVMDDAVYDTYDDSPCYGAMF